MNLVTETWDELLNAVGKTFMSMPRRGENTFVLWVSGLIPNETNEVSGSSNRIQEGTLNDANKGEPHSSHRYLR